MNEIHRLPKKERQIFFDAAVVATGIPFPLLEKDFWVVWVLERLFSLPDLKTHLTFKGGTSLSKVYGIIQRFSEDIDLSIEKEFLGFGQDRDPEMAVSKKKREAALKALSTSCSQYVQMKLLFDLRKAIATKLGSNETWELSIDSRDPDGQTLLFEYPNISARGEYIQQSVKIEIGARSEHWPISNQRIRSYLKSALPDSVVEPEIWVRILNAERTFWEKATILHQYAHLPMERKLPPRISRHLYDFYCLLNSTIKEKALAEYELLERVAMHKSIYFSSGWANYADARKGTLKLLPPERMLEELKEDFILMDQMFFGEIPDWHVILKKIKEFQTEFNSQK